MDDFESKHNMIQMLLDMLKGSASDEVMGGMKAPEPAMDDPHALEVEKIKVMPHDGEEAMPEAPKDEPSMADSIMHKGEPAEEEAAKGMEDEEDNLPAFSSLLKRKK